MFESQSTNTPSKVRKIPSLKDNFGLTKSQFDRYVENLREGDDSFFTDHLATQLPESMSYLQAKFGCSRDKAYDTCLDTFLNFRTKILNGKITYGNLRFLFTRMCINEYIDHGKNQIKVKKSICEFLALQKNQTVDQEDFFVTLDWAIDQLPDIEKDLIKDLYYSEKSMQTLAEEKSLSYSNLRKKKERTIKKIRTYFFNRITN